MKYQKQYDYKPYLSSVGKFIFFKWLNLPVSSRSGIDDMTGYNLLCQVHSLK